MTFRLRLVLASMSVLVVGLGALLALGNVLLAQRVKSEASTVVRANADSQLSALAVTATKVTVRPTANDAALDRRGWVFDGDRVIERPPDAPAALDRLALRLGRARRLAEVDGPDEARVRAVPVHAPGTRRAIGAVVVAYPVEPLERLQQTVLLASFIVAALILMAGGLAIRSAIDGALRPVADMTATAESWGAHDLERRFDLGPARDELGGLAATLDGLLARIAASRRHERHFAGEVVHELRTPLAALRTRAEVALGVDGPDAAGEQREALQAVVTQAERLTTTVETLLAVSRQELDPTEGTVDLRGLAGEIEDVELVGDGPIPLAEGDPDIVRRALEPLLDNARRHATGGVRLELTPGAGRVLLAVRDDGPGVEPEIAERIFDPGFRGGRETHDGAGLGLPLARRLARSCGGDVRIGEGAGGCFVLDLPALGRGPG